MYLWMSMPSSAVLQLRYNKKAFHVADAPQVQKTLDTAGHRSNATVTEAIRMSPYVSRHSFCSLARGRASLKLAISSSRLGPLGGLRSYIISLARLSSEYTR